MTFGNEPVWNSIIEVTTWAVLGHKRPHAQLDVKDRFGSKAEIQKFSLRRLGPVAARELLAELREGNCEPTRAKNFRSESEPW
jgi:hypothetical protein